MGWFLARASSIFRRLEESDLPDSLRFLFVLLVLGGIGYGTVWALSHFPPEQTEIVKSLPHEKLRQK